MTLQDFIHNLELGTGARRLNRFLRVGGILLGLLVLVAAYDLRAFRNLSTQEAMDNAQLARNLAEGKGYSTLFIRPLSLYPVTSRQQDAESGSTNNRAIDPGRLRTNHPDLANPPLYPVLLAGLMKVLPFRYAIPSRPTGLWGIEGLFYRYQPDFFIALFNQFLFFLLILGAFFLARRLFDAAVAWLSTILLVGTELLWRFSVSGLSTLLLALLFLALTWCLVLLEEEAREPKWTGAGLFLLSALAGAVVGLGGLTRYAFCWLILPVLVFVALHTGRRRWALTATAFAGMLLVLAPWVVRNYSLSGMPFGTATFAIVENTYLSPEDRLPRSLNPDIFRGIHNSFPFLTAAAQVFWPKLVANSRALVQSDLPKLGGTWVAGFFLVGLLVRFHRPQLGRLRGFILMSLLVLAVTQALGRTKLSDDSPEINSENLLVLLTPLVVMYGVSFFFVVLDQVQFPWAQLRTMAVGAFAVIASLPLILVLLPPRTSALVYPPYYPPSIQTAVGWTKEDELMMSDIPWAVAWYGQSQCVSLTLNVRVDFFALNNYLKPVSALYLTPQTVDRWTQAGDWGNLFLQTIRVLPGDSSKYPLPLHFTWPQRDGAELVFPLNYLQAGWPMQLLFTAREHWPGAQ